MALVMMTSQKCPPLTPHLTLTLTHFSGAEVEGGRYRSNDRTRRPCDQEIAMSTTIPYVAELPGPRTLLLNIQNRIAADRSPPEDGSGVHVHRYRTHGPSVTQS